MEGEGERERERESESLKMALKNEWSITSSTVF